MDWNVKKGSEEMLGRLEKVEAYEGKIWLVAIVSG